ncbi:unnamed protein product [Urochloa humidicola]
MFSSHQSVPHGFNFKEIREAVPRCLVDFSGQILAASHDLWHMVGLIKPHKEGTQMWCFAWELNDSRLTKEQASEIMWT